MTNNLFDSTTDFLGVLNDISAEDADAWKRAASMRDQIEDGMHEAWEAAEYRTELLKPIGDLDIMTDGLDIPGHKKHSPLAAGLIIMELTRIDGSIGTAMAVQAGLALRAIAYLGSDEQKQQWLSPLAKGDKFGAFGLTEPDHGSDSIALETTAVRDGDEFVLNGEKKWIGNGSCGHVTVIFARMEDGNVGAFLVPQDTPGYNAETQTGKISLRAIKQAHIKLENCRVPASAQMPGCKGFKDVANVLHATRSGVAWMALGSAVACYEIARNYVLERQQFGRELARTQIIQQRLTNMLIDISQMMLICRHVTAANDNGTMLPEQASMAKLHNTRAARRVAAEARDMLGGVGILLENHIIRHMVDLEAMHTYEGTDTVQSLIIGKQITGYSAYNK